MKTRVGDFNKLGVWPTEDGMMFTFGVNGDGPCEILLYHISDGTLVERVAIDEKFSVGDVYSVVLIGKNWNKLAYLYAQNDETFLDSYARVVVGREKWADDTREEKSFQVLGGFASEVYQWQNDMPQILPQDMIIYKLHMRGFTMQHSLPVSKRGNYRGFLDKLSELKELGITSIEFQPIYDFEDLRYQKKQMISSKGEMETVYESLHKVNYWGYGEASYMAPKASYFGGKDVSLHCKEMIDAIHGEQMEVIMEISFTPEVSEDYMMDCLEFWVREYHVDGFHILGCNAPMARIADSKFLAKTKIFYEVIPQEILFEEKNRKHLFLYNDYFMHVTRQIQNHMQGSMVQFTNHLKRQNDQFGFVNYIANTDGFTLLDSYSYGEKHNEANGEENKDGNNINYSFNYGAEGVTKNRTINQNRLRQVRNGLCSVFLAQAVPLLRGGDEVLNSQAGNNNPYCQDNEIGWVAYNKNFKNKNILLDFTKNLIQFRKDHPALSMDKAMRMTDYKHVGMPDISYHGSEPWLMGIGEEQKALGIMYAGAYANKSATDKSENVYVAYNFHYDKVSLALPKIEGDRKWKFVMNTIMEDSFSFVPQDLEEQRTVVVPGGSISIFVS